MFFNRVAAVFKEAISWHVANECSYIRSSYNFSFKFFLDKTTQSNVNVSLVRIDVIICTRKEAAESVRFLSDRIADYSV